MDAEDIIEQLGLKPHPEGGHYREIYRHAPDGGERGWVTSIYYLLRAAERSHWHRVDAAEVWHFHAGAPLALSLSPGGTGIEDYRLGIDLAAGERPLLVVPPFCWQAAQSLGDWTLAGCTVAPAFQFAGFEMVAPDWSPGGARMAVASLGWRPMAFGYPS